MSNDNNNITDKGCKHVQLVGMAFYDESKYFMFAPDVPVPGNVRRYRKQGIAQQMSDGTFDFVAKPQPHPKSTLIKKLAHGRVSKTKDGAVQLTLKVYCSEDINISEAMRKEAMAASDAVSDYQLKR